MTSVLSLQKISLLYIITHLNSFSPRVLSLLPAKLRHELMKNVPVADLWWLESSIVRDGVNIETVWSHILSTRLPKSAFLEAEGNLHGDCYAVGHPKELYMEIVACVMFDRATPVMKQAVLVEGYQNNRDHGILNLVFGVRKFLDITNWKMLLTQNGKWLKRVLCLTSEDVVVPARYHLLHYNKEEISDTRMLSLLSNECCYFPKKVNILASSFVKSSLWNERKYPVVLECLRKYLSNAERFSFSAINQEDCIQFGNKVTQNYPSALRFVTTEILASRCPHLHHIQISGVDMKTLACLLSTITPLFGQLSSPYAKQPINHIPYHYLKELRLSSYENSQSMARDSVSEALLCECISDIVQYQRQLEGLFLRGINLDCSTDILQRLPAVMMEFIHRPNWRYLHIDSFPISVALFQSILQAYLCSPTQSRCSLFITGMKLNENSQPLISKPVMEYIPMMETDFEHKQLVMREAYLPVNMATWLFSRHHHFRLHLLELDAISVHPNMSLLSVIAHHPNLLVEILCFRRTTIRHCNMTADDFVRLLTKDKLQVLVIKQCRIGESGVLDDITTAFNRLHLWRGKMVTFLNLEQNRLGVANIQSFFAALFQLQLVDQLNLDISNNDFNPQHVAMVNEVWRTHNNGRTLKQLKM